MTYPDLLKRATEKGFREIVCGTCAGKQSAVPAGITAASETKGEPPCPACNGSGRLWLYEHSNYILTDDQLVTAT
jgi:hypothetical protein